MSVLTMPFSALVSPIGSITTAVTSIMIAATVAIVVAATTVDDDLDVGGTIANNTIKISNHGSLIGMKVLTHIDSSLAPETRKRCGWEVCPSLH